MQASLVDKLIAQAAQIRGAVGDASARDKAIAEYNETMRELKAVLDKTAENHRADEIYLGIMSLPEKDKEFMKAFIRDRVSKYQQSGD